jgi:hypothetical protein
MSADTTLQDAITTALNLARDAFDRARAETLDALDRFVAAHMAVTASEQTRRQATDDYLQVLLRYRDVSSQYAHLAAAAGAPLHTVVFPLAEGRDGVMHVCSLVGPMQAYDDGEES